MTASKKDKVKLAKRSDTNVGNHSQRLLGWRSFWVGFFAITSGLIHRYHVATIFENDRHFSHLSTLEREMTFRSEMGMYYSYFKTIVQADSLMSGIEKIMWNNVTEFPDTINALERFNLLPEVILGGLYHVFNYFCDVFDIAPNQCWQVHRGSNIPPVYSCEGIRQPEYFYLEGVWACATLTGIVLFLYGVLISDSIIGGLMAVLCFFFNHSECTRVQWTPPLRESFAYPFCLLQMYWLTSVIKFDKSKYGCTNKDIYFQIINLCFTTLVCLLLWQFSQFFLATQIIALLLMFGFGYLTKSSINAIICAELVAVLIALSILFGNELLRSSLLLALLLSSTFVFNVFREVEDFQSWKKNCFLIAAIVFLTVLLKIFFLQSEHGSHIINVLHSKVSSYKDFDTLLYTCSPEFDFLGWEPIVKISYSWLLPIAMGVLFVLFTRWIVAPWTAVEPHIIYNVLQLGAFAIMAIFIMRLKLFFTPHLGIMASLIASFKYCKFTRSAEVHFSLLVILIGGMSVTGLTHIWEQHSVMGEYSNYSLEELLLWIQESTPKNAVFAGSMPITSAILLSTGRPIVNHPHYEHKAVREKTKKVYSIYSRKPPEEILDLLSSLKVEYVVISGNWCFHNRRVAGCRHTDLWDIEDPKNKHRRPVCSQLFMGLPLPFHRVFVNDEYVVLKLPSPSVEISQFDQ